ncbi:hypothetical protein HYV12_03815 [Candidatus Dojkabacteria bacterium]|nr:hypothetical protein [Candidatus Dojkabacteria bacterium]
MQIYGFAFSLHNISTRTLYKLDNIDHRYLIFRNNINRYLEILRNENPEYILGLGIYSRKSDNLHLETECHNVFQHRLFMYNKEVVYKIDSFLKGDKLLKQSNTIGSYMCNMVSFKIMDMISKGEITSKFSFIHIPKNIENGMVIEEIDRELKDLLRT